MKFIISGLLILATTSCSQPLPPKKKQLNMLSNDGLCSALGTYNSNGRAVLEIYDELRKRAEKIDNERCHALEIKAREETKDSYNDYPNNPGRDSRSLTGWESEARRLDAKRMAEQMNRLIGNPSVRPSRHGFNPNF